MIIILGFRCVQSFLHERWLELFVINLEVCVDHRPLIFDGEKLTGGQNHALHGG